MSKKKGKYSVECPAVDEAMEHLLSAIVKAAGDQFKGDEIPVDMVVKMSDEILLSTIRNMITLYFEIMTAMILDLKKEAKKS